MLKINKDPSHWLVIVILIALGVVAGEWLGSHNYWTKLRYRLYQYVQEFSPREVYPKRTALVLIGDDEYWKGELAHRVPIKRDYLAQLVRALDKADPDVIALDFDLRLRVPDGSLTEHSDYAVETREFLETIRDVSQRRTVVLARTLGFDSKGNLVKEKAVYDYFNFYGGDVRNGYIELPYDLRQVPMPLPTSQSWVDSFAVAIVRSLDTRAVKLASLNDALPYGTFIKYEQFKDEILPAKEVLIADSLNLRKKLKNKIVIIGASWSKLAYRRGGLIDADQTPIGVVGGVFMHANYVEALLDQRTNKPLNHAVAMWIEILFAVVVAAVFSLVLRPFVKFLFTLVIFVFLVILAYFAWQNLGLFFDFFIPLVLLTLHAIAEQVAEWRSAAHSGNVDLAGEPISAEI